MMAAEPARTTEALPVPPLRLRRIRLCGVGPDGARFDPLDLDFTTADGAASRVLLSLTNTGGKSTLITLVSSLVVPASRSQVGGKNLGDYVLTGDTSHVVCEWEDATTGTRTVAGTVMEWKDGRRQPGHKQRSTTSMHRAWYLFRTGPGLPRVDDLPFVVDGRRAVFEKYLAMTAELVSHRAQAQWVLARTQQEWTRTLEERTSIDPVLFGYQMRMNDAEAGAQKLLATFDSADNVVRFFVAALNDDREIADFTDKLAKYAELAAGRPELETLRDFCAEISQPIVRISARAAEVATAEAAAVRARIAGGEHATALANRVAQDRSALVDLNEAADKAALELAAARREYGQISDIRLQLQLEQARARLVDAGQAKRLRTEAAERAEFEARAWEAVDLVIEIDGLRKARDAAQQAYDAAEAGLGPLRDQVATTAAQLAGRLEALAEEAIHTAETAEQLAEEADELADQALDAEKEADARNRQAAAELRQIDAQLQAAEKSRADAVDAGWLGTTEQPEHCVRRWEQAKQAAQDRMVQQTDRANVAKRARTQTDNRLDALATELASLHAAAQEAKNRMESFEADYASVAAHDVLEVLLGGPLGFTTDLVRVAELAQRSAHDADVRAAEQDRVAKAARDEMAHLDETGTAPTGPDVLTVLTALIDARIGAVTGLEWIERNIAEPEARPGFIKAHPEFAGGVVVSDPTRFETAVSRLADMAPRTRTPVTVMTTQAATPAGEQRSDRYVVLPHRATWDRDWAATVRVELAEIAATAGSAEKQARDAATAYRACEAACRAFAARWSGTDRADLARHAEASAEAAERATTERERLASVRDQHRLDAENAQQNADTARHSRTLAETRAKLAAELADLSAAAAVAAARVPAVEAAAATAQRDAAAALTKRQQAREIAKAATGQAAQARSAREGWQRERDQLGVERAAPDPGGNLDVIRGAWETLRLELSTAERGMVEADQLDRANRALNQALGKRRRYDEAILTRASEQANTTLASSRESLNGEQRRARELSGRLEKERLAAEHELTVANEAVRAAQPTAGDRQNHVDLSNVPEWRPTSPSDIPGLLERLETRNIELRDRRDAAETAETEARELRDEVAADIEAFTDLIGLWTENRVPTDKVFAGSKDAARSTMKDMLDIQRQADRVERSARENLQSAVNIVRRVASDARWHALDKPVAVRIRILPDPDLVAESDILSRRVRALTESASGDLAAMDTHRAILRDELVTLCREQRRMLREVSRTSRLPAGLGDLSGQPAIKIRFEDAPNDETAARLASRVDSWAGELAANPKRASSAEVRARWLADAVRDTVLDRSRAGAWSIEILKPRIDGRVMYCPPDRIPHEFSGGQVLTLAVLVYCALSGVRSAHRPGGARPAGTLILDNPFGAASAETLIEMQHRLAAHTGLQLVCATGLNDANVDAAFTGAGSVIVKLRNDGDLRRNLSFLRLRSRIVDGTDVVASILGDRSASSPQNWVDATRYEIRQ